MKIEFHAMGCSTSGVSRSVLKNWGGVFFWGGYKYAELISLKNKKISCSGEKNCGSHMGIFNFPTVDLPVNY